MVTAEMVVLIILVMTEKCISTRVSDRNGEAKVIYSHNLMHEGQAHNDKVLTGGFS